MPKEKTFLKYFESRYTTYLNVHFWIFWYFFHYLGEKTCYKKKQQKKTTKKQKTIFKYSWRTLGEDSSPAQHVNDIVTIVLFDSSFPHPILNKASYLAQQLLDWSLMLPCY